MLHACRGCRGAIDPFLDFGAVQLTGYLAPAEAARPSHALTVGACTECGLVQLTETAPQQDLYTQCWYQSGINEGMRAELSDVVRFALARVELRPADAVLDLGANDGTLLASYATEGWPKLMRIAFEPAHNLQDPLQQHAEMHFCDYFPDPYKAIQPLEGKIKIITSIAMVYGVDDLPTFLTAIAALLHEDGVWVVQFQDLAGMIHATAFDNICHEHLAYFSLATFSQLLVP